MKADAARRRAEEPEAQRERIRAWRAANKDRVRDYNIAYRAAHKDETAEYTKQYREKNSDEVKRRTREWREQNPDYWRSHVQKRRAAESAGTLSKGLHRKLLKLQKGKCACCKSDIRNKSHMDHVVPLALGGKNEDANIQLLCPRCNLSKHAKHPVDFMRSRGFLL